jgi:hypothetical protein
MRITISVTALAFGLCSAAHADSTCAAPHDLAELGFASEQEVIAVATHAGQRRSHAIDTLNILCADVAPVVARLITDRDPEVADQMIWVSGKWTDASVVGALVARMTDRRAPAVLRIDAFDELVERQHPLAARFAAEIERVSDGFFAAQAKADNRWRVVAP